jgi:hypothetical protein
MTYKTATTRGKSDNLHRILVQGALGKPIPKGAHVHHVNGDCRDNSRGNLVLCENAAYHGLLHVRYRSLKECGNPNHRKCVFCGKYDDTENMVERLQKNRYHHASCSNEYLLERHHRKMREDPEYREKRRARALAWSRKNRENL